MQKYITLLVLLMAVTMITACGATSTQESSVPKITVTELWSRPSPMKAGNGAVYMVLTNEGGEDDALISAKSDVSEVVELHETKMEGDMMKMQPVSKIEVPAGGSARLEPGGLHVMLINLKQELVEGEKVTLTLNFEKSDPITIEAEIREAGGG